jgi:cyclophilin family peptidyl-prolyl cis-trans isomerase
MNFSQEDPPNSRQRPLIFIDISSEGKLLGRLKCQLYRNVFPLGVENFVNLIKSSTYKNCEQQYGRTVIEDKILRTYKNCCFFDTMYNNYIMSGDIYSNTGFDAGTIYNDEPIPPDFGECFYTHNSPGLISLVPYKDDETDDIYYDSTFMITLNEPEIGNIIETFDENQIVIGSIIDGMEILDKINKSLKPFAGKRYPKYYISQCGVIKN